MAKKTEETAEDQLPNGFDSQAMLKENGEKKTVIRYADRVRLEIIQDTRHYRVGQIINPHKVMGEALVKQGIAKEAKA